MCCNEKNISPSAEKQRTERRDISHLRLALHRKNCDSPRHVLTRPNPGKVAFPADFGEKTFRHGVVGTDCLCRITDFFRILYSKFLILYTRRNNLSSFFHKTACGKEPSVIRNMHLPAEVNIIYRVLKGLCVFSSFFLNKVLYLRFFFVLNCFPLDFFIEKCYNIAK